MENFLALALHAGEKEWRVEDFLGEGVLGEDI